MRNNARFFVRPDHFIRLITTGTVNNVIEIGYLDHGMPSDADIENNIVYCSIRGRELEQVASADLDVSGNVDKFSYETITGTGRTVIKLAVDKIDVSSISKAKKYITGLLVDYQLEDLVYANSAQNPLYQFKAYLSDGTLVAVSEACTMDVVRKKMDSLDREASINKIGFYEYRIRRATVKR